MYIFILVHCFIKFFGLRQFKFKNKLDFRLLVILMSNGLILLKQLYFIS